MSDRKDDPTANKLFARAGFTGLLTLANLALMYREYRPGRNVMTGEPLSIMFAVTALLLAAVTILELRKAVMKARANTRRKPRHL